MTKKQTRSKAITKSVFTEKPETRVVSDEWFQQNIKAITEDFYKFPDEENRSVVRSHIDNFYNQVVNGELFVLPPVETA